jgi:hypothetical protein
MSNVSRRNIIAKNVTHIETYILYLLLGPSKRFASKPIYDAIKALNNKSFKQWKV